MFDAVTVLAKAIDDLVQMEGFRTDAINCQSGAPWRTGAKVAEAIKYVADATSKNGPHIPTYLANS